MTDKPRELSGPERAIWQRVLRTVTPKSGREQKLPVRLDVKAEIDRGPYMRVPPKTLAPSQAPQGPLEQAADKRVRRGRVQIDRRVDLHDMTREQARPALISAVRSAYARGEKCILVITGKGPRLKGVLRQSFTSWINEDDIRPMIASYAPSHIRHGGTGAWYVFLKRKR